MPAVQIGEVVAEYGVDTNGNGQFDNLVIEVEMTANQAGEYAVRAQLGASRFEPDLPDLIAAGEVLDEVSMPVILNPGSQIVRFTFDGKIISQKRSDGPYEVRNVWVIDDLAAGPTEYENNPIDNRHNTHLTAAYAHTDFETGGALLSREYSHSVSDADGDGEPDALIVTTGLNIYESNEYEVVASLYDRDDKAIGYATWRGNSPAVTLQFDDIAGTVGPYTLRDIELRKPSANLLDPGNTGIDYFHEVYVIELIPELVTATEASFDLYPDADGIGAFSAEATNVFNTSVVDGNLRLDAEVDVATTASFRLEAWLADVDGNLVTWGQGDAVELSPGIRSLSLTFNGADIQAHGIPGPYSIVALKILKGDVPYDVLDSVNEAFTTSAYPLNQFASVNPIFEDFAENGTSQWSTDGVWGIDDDVHQYLAASQAWYAGNADASLTLNTPLNFSSFTSFTHLKFVTGYSLTDGDVGYVEASTNGNNWTTLASYTGNGSWSDAPQIVDLTDYAGEPAVHLRFRLAAAGGSTDGAWYIDDIVVAAQIDTDGDLIPDVIEGTGDTDSDGTPDYLDDDSDGDGIPDIQEGADDTDNDGTPDFQDTEADGDGIPDSQEGGGDTDGDGTPDFLDDDSDGDGILDQTEGNGDTDGDGVSDFQDTDSDNDGVPDITEGGGDQDSDGTPNFRDLDSDGDGVPDAIEGADDADGDQQPNFLDIDADGDTMVDGLEWTPDGALPLCTNTGGLDTDGDEIANCYDNDADGDGILNFLDTDSDADGIPDITESIGDLSNPADADQDGILDYLDADNQNPDYGAILKHRFLPAIFK